MSTKVIVPSRDGDASERPHARRLRHGEPRETAREGIERELGASSAWTGSGAGFAADLTLAPPSPLGVGEGNAAFLGGRITPAPNGTRPELLLDGEPAATPVTVVDPPGEGPAFWWTLLELPAGANGRTASLALRGGGARGAAELGELEIDPAAGRLSQPGGNRVAAALAAAGGEPLVVICMATHEPSPELFARQIESIKRQSHGAWICLISDDGSAPESLSAMREAIGEDPRFVRLEHERRLGFYGNYERALAAVPAEADLVALADQDDRWYPDKLTALIAGLGERDLVYGDMRIATEDGSTVADTFWTARRNNYTDLASLLVGNTVTGSVALFRADLLSRALPFPPRRGRSYHDHWIALTALTRRGIAYLDRPLQDYIQHGENVQGHELANLGARHYRLRRVPDLIWETLRAFLGARARRGWAARYFGMYQRTVLWARILLMRAGGSVDPAQAKVLRRIAAAHRSPRAMAWLAGRSLRPFWGRNEAFGRELLVLTSALWGRALELRVPRGRPRKRPTED